MANKNYLEENHIAAPVTIMETATLGTAFTNGISRGIRCNTEGVANLTMSDGTDHTVFLRAGQDYPYRVVKVNSSGTTAGGLKGLF